MANGRLFFVHVLFMFPLFVAIYILFIATLFPLPPCPNRNNTNLARIGCVCDTCTISSTSVASETGENDTPGHAWRLSIQRNRLRLSVLFQNKKKPPQRYLCGCDLFVVAGVVVVAYTYIYLVECERKCSFANG